ncbi:flavodoxin domain-containing protein [Pacificoceanicola onchidii]|uniref:flavodoxin domain-containing protein n=1 Tax=Pacificoceanicola onchidii TaxID=2562685 RepID=UPI0010A6094E|nr:flavodoxin domain-containing protein [Pacificoceanicola onchidii]
MKIHFLYGTETGNSEILCDDMQDELGADVTSRISDMGTVDPADLDPEEFHIVVTSTYGNGDLPSTAVSFSDALAETKPDLSGIRFAIFGLGDMVFAETFAQGSKTLMEQLLACKAEQVGERGIFDASGADMPEDIGVPWLHGILALLQAKAA